MVTLGNISRCASLLSVGLRVPKERADQTWKAVARLLPLAGERRRSPMKDLEAQISNDKDLM